MLSLGRATYVYVVGRVARLGTDAGRGLAIVGRWLENRIFERNYVLWYVWIVCVLRHNHTYYLICIIAKAITNSKKKNAY